ncbi:CRE-IFD-1 protein [Caenorhabditis remanei]|uniref:CRE-IFD-1 protein n=1 Tax=Caenorhabditis remanei TaxID=31234 RepID=E3NDX4_CAERE|nr:CRE-IFD-1 protein [Caenorhabditis remanei]
MSKPIKPLRIVHNPVLARIIESGATNLPTGVTASGQLSILGANAAAGIRDNRDREKREIAELNNRLARYIEKVRFLEAQNRVLESDIGLFRQAAHIHSGKITVYYEAEKTSLVTLVREHDAKVSSAKQNIRKLEPEIATARKNWEMSLEHRQTVRSEKRSQMEKLSHIEAETAFFKRIINDCEEEKGHIKSEISRLRGEIKRVLAQRDKERSGFARSQSAAQDLLKKLNGTISQHEIAIREEINKARRDSTDKNRDYFHRELNLAMKEIRDQFESNTKKTRKTWDEWYKKKITDIKKTSERYTLTQTQAREEILRIRSFLNELRVKISDADTFNQQLAKRIEEMKYREEEDLRMFEHSLNEKQYATERMMDECAKLSVEVERLVENQITLRNEIAYYRKLMESAEHIRTTHQSNFVIDTPSPLMRTTSYHSHGSAFTLNVRDTQDKIVHHDNYDISNLSSINSQQFRSYSKGDVKIMEHKDESIVIENADNYKSKDLSNWKIHHYVDGALVGTFIFPIATHIHPRDKITVIHSLQSSNLLDDLVAHQIYSFDFSKNTKTVLVDDADEVYIL